MSHIQMWYLQWLFHIINRIKPYQNLSNPFRNQRTTIKILINIRLTETSRQLHRLPAVSNKKSQTTANTKTSLKKSAKNKTPVIVTSSSATYEYCLWFIRSLVKAFAVDPSFKQHLITSFVLIVTASIIKSRYRYCWKT